MDRENQAKRSLALFLVFSAALFIIGANCTLGRMLTDQVNLDMTNTSLARDTEWSMTYTQEAKMYNGQTATVEQATQNSFFQTQDAEIRTNDAVHTAIVQTELAPKPPVITGISFPKEIPGNKSTMIGLLYFKDTDGDISHVIYRVVSAIEFGGGTDTAPKLDSGTWTDGALKIYLWCEGAQDVTLEATIVDLAGNKSNPMTFSFTCK